MLDVFYAGKSLRSVGAIVNTITPMPRAQRRMTLHEVPGRSGMLHVEDTGYGPVTRDIALSVRSQMAAQAVNDWCVSYGEMVVTSAPGYFFKAYQHADFEWNQQSERLYTATIQFEVMPYWYMDSGRKPVDLAEPGTIFNAQSIESEPLIELYATGEATLYIGNYIINLTGLSGKTTIDSEAQMTLGTDGAFTGTMRGDYPLLFPKKNEVNWIGGVERVRITPRWRHT